MARDAIYSLLKNDAQLTMMGGTGWVVLPNFSGDQRPNDAGGFMVIRWGVTDFDPTVQANAAHHFDLWVHFPALLTTDFTRIDAIVDRVDEVFTAANETTTLGADGWSLVGVDQQGRSGDLIDGGYQTICRRASYKAFSFKA